MTTWDANKRLANLAKHGVDFRDLEGLDWERALIFEDRRKDYGEPRLIAMAPLDVRLHMVVFVERAGERRIISARKANSREVACLMRKKLVRPTRDEDAKIARGIAADPDAAPDLSEPVPGIVRRPGRPPQADRKVSVTLRLDRDVVERFKAAGAGWQTRINTALKKSVAR